MPDQSKQIYESSVGSTSSSTNMTKNSPEHFEMMKAKCPVSAVVETDRHLKISCKSVSILDPPVALSYHQRLLPIFSAIIHTRNFSSSAA